MPVISKSQFIAITDRLSAEYDLFLKVDRQINSPTPHAYYQSGSSYPARLLVDVTGTGTHMLLKSFQSGGKNNELSFTMVNPGVASSALASISAGNDLGVSLQTDSNKNIVTTADDLVAFMIASDDFNKVDVIYPVTNIGGLVQTYPRTMLSGGLGGGTQSDPLFTIIALRGGTFGNWYTIVINLPSGPNQPLKVTLNGPDLVVNLRGNSSGDFVTTVAELAAAITALAGSSNVFQYGTVSNFVVLSQHPTAVVPPQILTPFSGGGNGPVAPILLTPPEGSTSGTADPDVSKMVPAAQELDKGVTARTLSSGTNVIYGFMASLQTHFTAVGFSGGMQGFLTTNNILVHKNFATMHAARVGNSLLAASVFRPDVVVLATISMVGTNQTFTSGTPLGLGTGAQSESNYGPQKLVAVLVAPPGGLAADWSFNLTLLASDGTQKASDPIAFTQGAANGTVVEITAVTTDNRFYAVIGSPLASGGTDGDKVIINQVVERPIFL